MGAWQPARPHELLLQAALLDEVRATQAFQAWIEKPPDPPVDPSSWRILPLLHRRLTGLRPMLSAPGSTAALALAARAQVAFDQTRYRNALLFDEAAAALRALREAGVSVCLLKGSALALSAYADPALRPMSDVDFLVKPADLERAIETLRRASWHTPQHLGPAEVAQWHSAPFTNDSRGSIDLHWRCLDSQAEGDGDTSLWESSRIATFEGESVRVPSPADLLLHACIGGTRWEGDAACRWVADALSVLGSSAGDIDWARVADEAARHAEAASVGEALEYLHASMGVPIPDDCLRRLKEAPGGRVKSLVARARQRAPEHRGPLLALALHIEAHRRLTRLGLATPGPVGFFRTMSRTWGLSSPWLVPVHVLLRGVRRLTQMGRHAWGRLRGSPLS